MSTRRRKFFLQANSFRFWPVLLPVALIWSGCENHPRATNSPAALPPIILFSIDTLRADHLGCYGYRRETSPRIDSFAQDAVLFQETIAQAPYTAPSHMSIFTSLYPPVHRLINFKSDTRPGAAMNKTIVTLPQFLQAQGYLTIGLTGGAQLDGGRGFAQGFDYYGNDFYSWEGEMRPTMEGLSAIKGTIKHWLRESRRENRPLFLFLHHYICHDPYVKGPPEYRQKFLDQRGGGLPRSVDDLDLPRRGIRKQFFGKADWQNPDHLQHYIALYDGGVYFSDAVFGELMDLLKEEGLFDPALIVLFSDHGEEFLEHGGYLHSQLFRETLRVPLIVKFPGGEAAGRTVERPVEALDIFPTIADFLGMADKLPPVQGHSLLPVVRGKPGYEGSPVSFSNCLNWVRFCSDGYTFSNQPTGETPEWLFADGDIEENRNLAEVEKEVVSSMRTRAREIMEENRAFREKLVLEEDGRERQPSPEVINQLRSLGYLN